MSTTSRKIKRIREQAMRAPETVEVCQSFARKFNLANYGGPQYESVDFFSSQKLVCRKEHRQMVSESLYEQCVEEVETAARNYMVEMKRKLQQRKGAA